MSLPSEHSSSITAQGTGGDVGSSQLTHFHRFPKLPKEIRQKIFEACLPRRLFRFAYEQFNQPFASLRNVADKPSALPWIAFVCKDAYEISRLFVREYRMDFTNIISIEWRQRICGTTRIRFNPDLDTLFVNYSGTTADDHIDVDALDHETYLQGLHDGPYALAMMPNVNVVLDMLSLVGPRDIERLSETKWLTARPYYDCLTQHDHCTVRLASTVIPATSAEIRSSGLFGMFGEERQILVDIKDTAKIDQYENYIQKLDIGKIQTRSRGWNYFPEGGDAPVVYHWPFLGARRYGTTYGTYEGAISEHWRFICDEIEGNGDDDGKPPTVFRSVAEKDAAIALTLIKQAWLEAHHCFEPDGPDNNPLIPWTGNEKYRKWDDNHHVAKHWLSKLPTFSFVAMYVVVEG